MGKPVAHEVVVKVDTSGIRNVMEVYDFWNEETPIPNVTSILVEFTPQGYKGAWQGVLYLANGEEMAVKIVEVNEGYVSTFGDDEGEFGFR